MYLQLQKWANQRRGHILRFVKTEFSRTIQHIDVPRALPNKSGW